MLVQHLELPSGRAALEAVPALCAALDGKAPLYVPVAEAGTHLTPVTRAEGLPEDAAFAIGTSGSTGTPKLAVLSAGALRASATATERAMGGPAQWILALPPHHIAGLQVMLRSIAAGHDPVPVERSGSFAPHHLTEALARARAAAPQARRYSSFVPTQLGRLLASDEGVQALRSLDGILVGGASTPAEMIDRCRDEGVPVITTYGMSETCGGCVYDGRPIDGVRVHLEPHEDDSPGTARAGAHTVTRVLLGGAPVAHGYLAPLGTDAPSQEAVRSARHEVVGTLTDRGVFSTDATGVRWFRTDDLGRWIGEGDSARLVLDGRVDDMVVTGGLKVLPRVVERTLEAHLPEGVAVLVVGVPDLQWGAVVAACFVPAAPEGVTALESQIPALLEAARVDLPAHALPRVTRVLPVLPMRGPGKPDRRAVREALTQGC